MKTCLKCNKQLELYRFDLDLTKVDGRSCICKHCRLISDVKEESKHVKERVLSRSELFKPKEPPKNPWLERDRADTLEREKQRLRAKRNDPKRQAARNAAQKAIKSGRLTPQPCEQCGNVPTEAHHDSYRRKDWLKVRWLCKKCHDKLSVRAWKEAISKIKWKETQD